MKFDQHQDPSVGVQRRFARAAVIVLAARKKAKRGLIAGCLAARWLVAGFAKIQLPATG
jgi:hypothetical protein